MRLPTVALLFLAASASAGDLPRDIPAGRWERSAGAQSIASPDDPFESLALSWSASCRAAARVRASGDGIHWSVWKGVSIDEDLTDRNEGRYFTSITHFEDSRQYVEYSFDAPCDVEALTVTLFPPPPATRHRRLLADSFTFGAAGVRSRSDWGCPDGQGSRWTPAYTTVTHAIVHHTAGANTVPDWEAEMRNIWYFHTVTRGWGDIGYNFLIDPNGVVYEGRAGGDGAIGAHFSCRNSNTAGVALLGTFTSGPPADAARESLEKVLAELTRRHGIAPDVLSWHTPTALDLWTISGHRDANPSPNACSATECPGNVLYSLLPDIRARVAAACDPVAITGQAAPATIASGATASLTVTARGSEPMSYQWYTGQPGDTSVPVGGASTATLTIAPVTTTQYWARVSNACSSGDSAGAVVTVTSASSSRRRPSRG